MRGGRAGRCPGSRAGAVFSNPFTSELARDCENTSLNRFAIGPTSALRADEDRRSEKSLKCKWFEKRKAETLKVERESRKWGLWPMADPCEVDSPSRGEKADSWRIKKEALSFFGDRK